MYLKQKEIESAKNWSIVLENGMEPECNIAGLIMHFSDGTKISMILGDRYPAGGIEVSGIADNMEIRENVLYVYGVESTYCIKDNHFVDIKYEDVNIWRNKGAHLERKDILHFTEYLRERDPEVKYCHTYTITKASGEKRIYELKAQIICDKGIKYLESTIKDITKVAILEEKIAYEKERLDIVSSLSADWIFEYTGEQEVMDKFSSMLHPSDKKVFKSSVERILDNHRQINMEVRLRNDKGEYEWNALSAKALYNKSGNPVSIIGKVTNIDTKKREELRLVEEAMSDSLTKLYNKIAFIKRAKEQLAGLDEYSKSAIAIIDIDSFKSINDSFGHLFGDTIISNMGSIIKENLDDLDFGGRFGGDEFIVYFHEYQTEEMLLSRLKEIHKQFAETYNPKEGENRITCSIGVALAGKGNSRFEELFERADKALYFVKSTGKDNTMIYDGMLPYYQFDIGSEKKLASKEDVVKKVISEDIMGLAFELLESSNDNDIEGGLNLLLGKIGHKFELNAVIIRQKSRKHVGVSVNYSWAEEEWDKARNDVSGRVITKDVWNAENSYFTGGQVEEVTDIELLPKNHPLYESCMDRGIRAFYICPLLYAGEYAGSISYISCKGSRVWKEEEKHYFTLLAKIISNYLSRETSTKIADERIDKVTSFDAVTGLYKLPRFKMIANDVVLKSSRIKYGIVSLDIANFKYFNEIYGFEAGDELIRAFAKMVIKDSFYIKAGCRDYADTFLMLVEARTENQLKKNVQEAVNVFLKKQNEIYQNCNIDVTMGAYFIGDGDKDITVAIDNANMARKLMKEERRTGYQLFTPDIKTEKLREIALSHMLDEALEHDEFVVYMQPKFSLEDGSLVGAEALARWKKSNGTVVKPIEFIPILEKSGKIVKLDFIIFEKTAKAIGKWIESGNEVVPVSINLSRHHMRNAQVVDHLSEILKNVNVPSKCIEIEVTESAFIDDQEALVGTMNKLEDSGYRVSIDDFGKGYSSLNMLTEIPADIVKIDKDFLKSSTNVSTRNLIFNVIKLIKDSQMRVVCEGVETREQADFLAAAGCDIAQGFFFSEPIPLEEFEKKYIYGRKLVLSV